MSRDKTLVANFATLMQARANCRASGNNEWRHIHGRVLKRLADNFLPHGSGIDGDTILSCDDAGWRERFFIHFNFHHMDELGFYDGWTTHMLTVKPTFTGIAMSVSGQNKRDIKNYLYEIFEHALTQTVPDETVRQYYEDARS